MEIRINREHGNIYRVDIKAQTHWIIGRKIKLPPRYRDILFEDARAYINCDRERMSRLHETPLGIGHLKLLHHGYKVYHATFNDCEHEGDVQEAESVLAQCGAYRISTELNYEAEYAECEFTVDDPKDFMKKFREHEDSELISLGMR